MNQKADHKRHSARERKPVTINDLGYNDNEKMKKTGKGAEAYKKCEKILNELKKHPCAEPFLIARNDEEYIKIVKEPMDLATVNKKLKSSQYTTSGQFAKDIKKIWDNSFAINQNGTDAFVATNEISKYFENLFKEVGDVSFEQNENMEVQEPKKAATRVPYITKKTMGNVQPKSQLEKPMTIQEKAMLKMNIMKLPPDKLAGIIDIIRDVVDMTQHRETLEFDIDTLPTRNCRELEQYVKKNIPSSVKSGKVKKQAARPEIKKKQNALPQTPYIPNIPAIPQVPQMPPIPQAPPPIQEPPGLPIVQHQSMIPPINVHHQMPPKAPAGELGSDNGNK